MRGLEEVEALLRMLEAWEGTVQGGGPPAGDRRCRGKRGQQGEEEVGDDVQALACWRKQLSWGSRRSGLDRCSRGWT